MAVVADNILYGYFETGDKPTQQQFRNFIDSKMRVDALLGFDNLSEDVVDAINAANGGFWTASGDDVYNNNAGNVGIGTDTPEGVIDVRSGNRRMVLDQNNNRYVVYGNSGDDQIYFDFDAHNFYLYANDNSYYHQGGNIMELSLIHI